MTMVTSHRSATPAHNSDTPGATSDVSALQESHVYAEVAPKIGTRALLRLERTMNLLEGLKGREGKGREGRMGERGWGGDGGRVGREVGEGT